MTGEAVDGRRRLLGGKGRAAVGRDGPR